MARTRVWATEESSYTDSTLATSIDNKGTELRQDTREIINQLLGVAEGTALADPVVNQTTSTIAVVANAYPLTQPVTLNRYLSHAAFRKTPTALYYTGGGAGNNVAQYLAEEATNSRYVNYNDASGGGTSTTAILDADVNIPLGATVTGCVASFYRVNAAEQITVSLESQSASTFGTFSQIAAATSAGATTGSIQTLSLGTLTTTLATDTFYLWRVTLTGAAGLAGPRFFGLKLTYTSPTANTRF